jgi:hypothetical protein
MILKLKNTENQKKKMVYSEKLWRVGYHTSTTVPHRGTVTI